MTQSTHDEVDRILAAWRAERPDLDCSPMAVWSRLTRLARHMELARKATFAALGLETWEFDVLTALRRAGSPYTLTPSRLAAETLVTSGTMTNRLDRLEQRDFVQRSTAPEDGRGIRVTLTASGITKVDAALTSLLEFEQEMLTALSGPERLELASLLRAILLRFDTI